MVPNADVKVYAEVTDYDKVCFEVIEFFNVDTVPSEPEEGRPIGTGRGKTRRNGGREAGCFQNTIRTNL